MPSFVSKGGEWFPAKEKAMVDMANAKSGRVVDAEPYVYEGLDREAVLFIAKEHGIISDDIKKPWAEILQEVKDRGLSTGMKVADDPQIMQLARDRGMTLDQYLEQNKPTPKQVKDQAEAQAKPVTHSSQAPKSGVQTGTKGGFYDPDHSDPVKEFNKK